MDGTIKVVEWLEGAARKSVGAWWASRPVRPNWATRSERPARLAERPVAAARKSRAMSPILTWLRIRSTRWADSRRAGGRNLGSGYECFPPTSLQISNLHAGTGAVNVVPGELELLFNFRFSPAVTVEQLEERTRLIVETGLLNEGSQDRPSVSVRAELEPVGVAVLHAARRTGAAAAAAIRAETGLEPELSTAGVPPTGVSSHPPARR